MTENQQDELQLHAPFGFFSFNDDGILVAVNAVLCENLGYETGSLAGKKVEEILTLASRIFYQTHLFPLIKLHSKADEIFISLLTKNKSDIPVLLNANRISYGDITVNLCACIIVSHRRKYEDELLQAKKAAENALKENEELIKAKLDLEQHKEMLDRHISKLKQNNDELLQLNHVIAHDLQEPLRKINIFTNILEKEDKKAFSTNGLEAIERIHASSTRILQLMNNLEKYVSTGTEALNESRVDLNKIVNRLFEEIALENKSIPIGFHADPLPVIEGDRQQLRLLFENLINNSILFRHPDKELLIEIHVSLIQHNSFKATKNKFKYVDFVKIRFSDNGIGFDNKYNDYVFRILKKIDVTSPGLGFGLAYCKKVVDNHYGSISVESEPGKGTVFAILLPLKQ